MEQIIVTRLDNSTLKLQSKENYSTIIKAVQTVELLGVDVVDITVESAVKMMFYIGDKITVIGRDYTLNGPARERKISDRQFVYDLHFEGVQYDLLRANYNVNVDTTNNQIQDINGNALTGDLKMFLDVLISNANRVFPGKWFLGTYPSGTETKTEVFSDNDNCLSVLQSLCGSEKYDTEFKIDIATNGTRTINVGSFGNVHTHGYEYGKGKGIYELTREKVSSSNIITRLFVYGSSRNIMTTKYRSDILCLPGKTKSQSYIEDAASVAKYGVWEYTKKFDEIFPQRTGTVTLKGDELTFVDSTMNFDLNERGDDGNYKYLVPGTPAKIHFNTGNLAGYEFELYSYLHANKTFVIKSMTDKNGLVFPLASSSAFQFAVGDKYVLLDVYMPQSYINTKEAELDTKGNEFYFKNNQPRVQYGLSVDPFFLNDLIGNEAETNYFWIGDFIPVKDTDIDVDKTIRIKSFTRDLQKIYSYSLSISDIPVVVSVINRIVSDVKNTNNVIRLNNLNDPAKARRNYLNAQEVLNMVFDVEGDFYTEKIKPASIDTLMLSVGAKSMQFGLMGTILQPNFGGEKNRVVYDGGVLTHYAILDSNGNPRVWNLANGDVVLSSDAAYYIYAKCEKGSSGGVLYFSTSKITVDEDGDNYHFLIGVLNSVDDNNARAVALMYGFTTINGRFIKTGRIVSNDGEKYFDLDTGEFRGDFTFTSGQSLAEAIEEAATSTYEAVEEALNVIDTIISDNVLSAAEKPGERSRWNDIYAEKAGINAQAAEFEITIENTDYNTKFQNLANYLNGGTIWSSGVPAWLSDVNLSENTTIVGATYRSKWNDVFLSRQTLLNAISLKSKNIADGATVTANAAKTTADTAIASAGDAAIAAANAMNEIEYIISDNVLSAAEKPGERSRWNDVQSESVGLYNQGTTFNVILERNEYNTAFTNLATYLNGGSTWTSGTVPAWLSDAYLSTNTAIVGATYRSKWNDYYTKKISLLNAISAKAKILIDAETAATAYLKIALQGSTDISGGLLATNVLLMKNSGGNITAGMSGLTADNIGMWAGGTYADAIASLAKIIMRKDGSGQLAGGKINWDAGGGMNIGLFSIFSNLLSSGNISFTSDSLDDLAGIPGSTGSVSPPDPITANSFNGWLASMTSSTFTLSKNSNVKFRVIQAVTASVNDNAYMTIFIKNSFGANVYAVDKSVYDTGNFTSNHDINVNLPAGTYYVQVNIAMVGNMFGNQQVATITGFGGSGSNITIIPIASLTKIANNGMYSYWGSSAYMYIRTDYGFEVMFGNYGIKCSESGLQKTSNGGGSWSSI